jgi:hypothetical protein
MGRKMTPAEEVEYAFTFDVSRRSLSAEAKVLYDTRLSEIRAGSPPPAPKPAVPPPAPEPAVPPPAAEAAAPPSAPLWSSPETRAAILGMFKRGNRKYAKPFESNRLALASFMGGNWEEYGQVVLQMAMLETLLSIEEKLGSLLAESSHVRRGVPDRERG